jgi:hypothetical protein
MIESVRQENQVLTSLQVKAIPVLKDQSTTPNLKKKRKYRPVGVST